jgi:hypothetical protein
MRLCILAATGAVGLPPPQSTTSTITGSLQDSTGAVASKAPEDGHGAPEEMLRLDDSEAIGARGHRESTDSHRRVYRGRMAMCSSLERALG